MNQLVLSDLYKTVAKYFLANILSLFPERGLFSFAFLFLRIKECGHRLKDKSSLGGPLRIRCN